MTLHEFLKSDLLKRLDLPQKLVCHYVRQNLISNPLSERDLQFLAAVSAIFENQLTLDCMLARRPYKDRGKMNKTHGLNKFEKRVFGYFVNGLQVGVGEDGEAIYAKRVTAKRVNLALKKCRIPLLTQSRIQEIGQIARNYKKELARKSKVK